MSPKVPVWATRFVALLGLVNVVSGVLPAERTRLEVLREVLPLSGARAAAAATVGLGLLLLLVASGLRRRKRRAWRIAVAAAAASSVLHVLKGLDVEEALLSLALVVVLVGWRGEFRAAGDPTSRLRAVTVFAIGVLLDLAVGLALLAVRSEEIVGRASLADRVVEVGYGLVGVAGPMRFEAAADADQVVGTLAALGVATLLATALVALRAPAGPRALGPEEEHRLRELLARHGHHDSLGYFALRRDKSVIFSKSGKAAVGYRVLAGVTLASGDPVGDPEAWPGAIEEWLAEARDHAWIPAVLGASERAGRVYGRFGLDALELGDEAILDTADFGLEGRAMRGVRQAVNRMARAGYVAAVARVGDIKPGEMRQIAAAAGAWRDGATERGFSMALGRLGDPADSECVLVTARDERGDLRGMLHFVPWGTAGLSLDIMRRDRAADNGVMEFMVAALMRAAPDLGVQRVSLNFAVFRSVFARGERLGAGPSLRAWHRVLIAASRFWQIESLYRANAKYRPLWEPRFLCFARARHLPRIAMAALEAEAFFSRPHWWRRLFF